MVNESDVKSPKRLHLVQLLNKGNDYHPFYSIFQHNIAFQVARFSHDFFHEFFARYFGHARNRARSHDKIFFVISNPGLNRVHKQVFAQKFSFWKIQEIGDRA